MSDHETIIRATAEAAQAARVFACKIEVSIKSRWGRSVNVLVLPIGPKDEEQPTAVLPPGQTPEEA